MSDLSTPLTVVAQFSGLGGETFLLGRVLFGAVLAFMGLNHFTQTDQMTGYAESKGLPAPRVGVLASGGTLLFGGVGIAAGAFPTLAAGGVAVFLAVSAVLFHDFWAVPEEQVQQELTQFLKNAVMLGGALVFLSLSNTAWPYAVSVGLL